MSFLFCPPLLFSCICQCFGQLSTANPKRCPLKLKQKRCSGGEGVGPATRQKQIHGLDLGGVKESQFFSLCLCPPWHVKLKESGGWHRCTIAVKAHEVACVKELILKKKSDGSDQKTLICNSRLPLSPSSFKGGASLEWNSVRSICA